MANGRRLTNSCHTITRSGRGETRSVTGNHRRGGNNFTIVRGYATTQPGGVIVRRTCVEARGKYRVGKIRIIGVRGGRVN